MFLYVTVSTLNPIVGMVEMTSPTCKRYRIVVLPAHGLVHLHRCMRVTLRGNEAAWASSFHPVDVNVLPVAAIAPCFRNRVYLDTYAVLTSLRSGSCSTVPDPHGTNVDAHGTTISRHHDRRSL